MDELESRRLYSTVPRFDHIVVLFEENQSETSIYANPQAAYLNSLAARGAMFTQSFGEVSGSLPNYLAMFSGSIQQANPDGSYTLSGANLATELHHVHRRFQGYVESPSFNLHDPWEWYTDLSGIGADLSAFPQNFTKLPTVSFVIPNLSHDMHSGSIRAGDHWAKQNLGGYAKWAAAHNSLLIVTWDEGDDGSDNHIATIFYGAHVKTGTFAEPINHYNVLRTIEDAYGLPPMGNSASTPAVQDAFG